MFRLSQRSSLANTATVSRGSLVLAVVINILVLGPAGVYSCGTCDLSYCTPMSSLQCDYGFVKDECNCCYQCAKGPGESCGGTFGGQGYCADGYDCIVQVSFGSSWTTYYQTPGVCSENLNATTTTAPTAPEPTDPADDDCRDNCTAEFCKDDKNRYCSATQNAFEEQEERGVCQHTTCKACRLLVGPTCPSCPEPVNKSCLRKYFMCISEHYQKDDIMLELDNPRAQNTTGRIVCHVPEVGESSTEAGEMKYTV